MLISSRGKPNTVGLGGYTDKDLIQELSSRQASSNILVDRYSIDQFPELRNESVTATALKKEQILRQKLDVLNGFRDYFIHEATSDDPFIALSDYAQILELED